MTTRPNRGDRGGRQERPRLAYGRCTRHAPALGRPAAGRTVSQLRVPDKTNEITAFTAVLAPFDLTGTVVTADALHTQRNHAKWLVETKQAQYLLVVKSSQPQLHTALRALPWKEATARGYDREVGHGRRETRSERTLTVTSWAGTSRTWSRQRRSFGIAPT
jgi:predicted transposase YbfD/YdcC